MTWDCGFYNYGNNTELYGALKLTVKYEDNDEEILLGCLDDSVEMWDTRALTNMIGSGVVPFVFNDEAIKTLLKCIDVPNLPSAAFYSILHAMITTQQSIYIKPLDCTAFGMYPINVTK